MPLRLATSLSWGAWCHYDLLVAGVGIRRAVSICYCVVPSYEQQTSSVPVGLGSVFRLGGTQ